MCEMLLKMSSGPPRGGGYSCVDLVSKAKRRKSIQSILVFSGARCPISALPMQSASTANLYEGKAKQVWFSHG